MNAKSAVEHKWRKENPPSTKINLKVSFIARLQLVALATATIVIIILIPAQLGSYGNIPYEGGKNLLEIF